MAIAFVNARAFENTSTGLLGWGQTEGDLLIVKVWGLTQNDKVWVTDTAQNEYGIWSPLTSHGTAAGGECVIFVCLSCKGMGSNTNTVTVNFYTTQTTYTVFVEEYSSDTGWLGPSVPDVAGSVSTGTSTSATKSVTNVSANALIISFITTGSGGVSSVTGGTAVSGTGISSGISSTNKKASVYTIKTSASSTTHSATVSATNDNWMVSSISIAKGPTTFPTRPVLVQATHVGGGSTGVNAKFQSVGNTLVCAVTGYQSTTASNITLTGVSDSVNGAYTQIIPLTSVIGASDGIWCALFFRSNIANSSVGANTLTITWGVAPNSPSFNWMEINGSPTGFTLVDSSNSGSGNSTSPTVTLTTAKAGGYILAVGMTTTALQPYGNNFINRIFDPGRGFLLEDRYLSSTASQAYAPVIDSSSQWILFLVDFALSAKDNIAPASSALVTGFYFQPLQVSISAGRSVTATSRVNRITSDAIRAIAWLFSFEQVSGRATGVFTARNQANASTSITNTRATLTVTAVVTHKATITLTPSLTQVNIPAPVLHNAIDSIASRSASVETDMVLWRGVLSILGVTGSITANSRNQSNNVVHIFGIASVIANGTKVNVSVPQSNITSSIGIVANAKVIDLPQAFILYNIGRLSITSGTLLTRTPDTIFGKASLVANGIKASAQSQLTVQSRLTGSINSTVLKRLNTVINAGRVPTIKDIIMVGSSLTARPIMKWVGQVRISAGLISITTLRGAITILANAFNHAQVPLTINSGTQIVPFPFQIKAGFPACNIRANTNLLISASFISRSSICHINAGRIPTAFGNIQSKITLVANAGRFLIAKTNIDAGLKQDGHTVCPVVSYVRLKATGTVKIVSNTVSISTKGTVLATANVVPASVVIAAGSIGLLHIVVPTDSVRWSVRTVIATGLSGVLNNSLRTTAPAITPINSGISLTIAGRIVKQLQSSFAGKATVTNVKLTATYTTPCSLAIRGFVTASAFKLGLTTVAILNRFVSLTPNQRVANRTAVSVFPQLFVIPNANSIISAIVNIQARSTTTLVITGTNQHGIVSIGIRSGLAASIGSARFTSCVINARFATTETSRALRDTSTVIQTLAQFTGSGFRSFTPSPAHLTSQSQLVGSAKVIHYSACVPNGILGILTRGAIQRQPTVRVQAGVSLTLAARVIVKGITTLQPSLSSTPQEKNKIGETLSIASRASLGGTGFNKIMAQAGLNTTLGSRIAVNAKVNCLANDGIQSLTSVNFSGNSAVPLAVDILSGFDTDPAYAISSFFGGVTSTVTTKQSTVSPGL